METFQASVDIPASVDQAFAYHERPGALNRLIPPWESVRIESSDGSIHTGAKVVLRTRVLGVPLRWTAEHTVYDPPHRFEDVAVSGPFSNWHHKHLFSARGAAQSTLNDRVEYRLPLGAIGKFCGSGLVRRKLEAMFAYRHRVTLDDLATRAQYAMDPIRIAITGASGLVGRELATFLTLMGHQVDRAKRQGDGAATTFAPAAGDWNGCDVVIHLAGKPIAEQRWTPAVKQAIADSRVTPTQTLCRTLAALPEPPKLIVCASATGIYGECGDQTVDESSPLGDDFLADVVRCWEAACEPAVNAGIRVVNLRLGIVLSPRGGALPKMLTPTKLGCGGPLGTGKQWWSWVASDDILGAIYHIIADETISGPVNCVAPSAVSCGDFARTLASVLRRPAILPVPAFALRRVMGEMADALLLRSANVKPTRLIDNGFRFRFPELRPCLEFLLGRMCLPR